MPKFSKKQVVLLNSIFLLTVGGILLFLLNAPEETTSHLPMDETHAQFHAIESKKEAEKSCTDCHNETGVSPLPPDHPPEIPLPLLS